MIRFNTNRDFATFHRLLKEGGFTPSFLEADEFIKQLNMPIGLYGVVMRTYDYNPNEIEHPKITFVSLTFSSKVDNHYIEYIKDPTTNEEKKQI